MSFTQVPINVHWLLDKVGDKVSSLKMRQVLRALDLPFLSPISGKTLLTSFFHTTFSFLCCSSLIFIPFFFGLLTAMAPKMT